jgi:hypothetical protein
VLQPTRFRQLRHELDVLWGTGAKSAKARRRSSSRAGGITSTSTEDSSGSGSDADISSLGGALPSSSSSSGGSGGGSATGNPGSANPDKREGILAAPRRLLGRAVTRERSKWVRSLLFLCTGDSSDRTNALASQV